MLIIVGLGNPGLTYKKTYHNVGFCCIDKLAKLCGVTFKHSGCKAKYAEYYRNSEKIIIAKPQTYMNLSGESVRELAGKFSAKPSEIIVVYDDIELPVGVLRIRATGSAGTHNGMRSIVGRMGENVPRIRIGTGKSAVMPLADFVLSQINAEDKPLLEEATDRAAQALWKYIQSRDVPSLANEYNGGAR